MYFTSDKDFLYLKIIYSLATFFLGGDECCVILNVGVLMLSRLLGGLAIAL